MATSKYEIDRHYFKRCFTLRVIRDPRFDSSDSFGMEADVKIQDIDLIITLRNLEKMGKISLNIYRLISTHEEKSRKKLDFEFAVEKIVEGSNSKVIGKRVLILLDADQCNTFNCKQCRPNDNCKFSYRGTNFCSLDTLMEVLSGQLPNQRSLQVSISGYIYSFGDYDIDKIMLPPYPFIYSMHGMDLTDVKLTAMDGRQFDAHKNILAFHSDVFSAMFRTEMKENDTGIVELKDLSSSGIEALLNFMYSTQPGDDVVKNSTLLLELLTFAEKYNIKTLISYCTEMLWLLSTNYFNLEDAFTLFAVSQQLKSHLLVEKVIEIFQLQKAKEQGDFTGMALITIQQRDYNYLKEFLQTILPRLIK